MPLKTVRIRVKSYLALKELSRATGQSMQDVLEEAIAERRRKVYLEGLSADYAALRADSAGSAEFDRENAPWDTTSRDGLSD